MTDTQFDDYFNDKLRDHETPVPKGLWDKLKNTQFDQHVGDSLKNHISPVPSGLYTKITDRQFDGLIAGKLADHAAPIPTGLWNKILDGQFDQFIAGSLVNHIAPVPEGLWETIRPKNEHDRKPVFLPFRYPAAALFILALVLGGPLGGYLFVTNGEKGSRLTIVAPIKPTLVTKNTISLSEPSSTLKENIATETEKIESHVLVVPQSPHAPILPIKVATNPFNPASTQLADQNLTPAPAKSIVAEKSSKLEENRLQIFEPYPTNLLTATTIPFSIGLHKGMQDVSNKKITTLNHTNQFRNVIICPADQKNRNTDWYLEVYTSPDIAIKSVSNNYASQQYLLTKDSSESMQVGYSAGLRFVKPITENMLVKAGLNYSQINQKYVYRTENEVKTTTVVTVRTIIRGPGDTVIVHDTSTVQQIGFKNNTVYNRFRSIDIPVTLGYQFGNEDLKFGINAGVVLNLTSWYQGVLLDSSLATIGLNKTGNGVYKTNLGLGLYAGLSVVKRLSDDMHIFIEPHLRYNLSNMTNPGSAYNQKISVGGLSLGIRLNLNRK